MKKIIYCKKCGYKVLDGDYCPKCGHKLETPNETTPITKNNRTRNILLIVLAIVIITSLLIIGGAYVSKNNDKEFKTYAFSDTCTVELPTWINFNEGAGDINSNANIAGSSVSSTTKALFGNSEVMQITYSKSVVDGQVVGVDLNDAMNVDVGGKKVYTRTVMSEETGESVSVMGENETLVNYIAEHAKFNGKTGDNKTNDNNSQTDNQKQAIAYKSDGTPMYSQAEVDSYVKSKYGDVNYHTQGNGYIALDDPSYTSDGRYRQPTPTPDPAPTPEPTPDSGGGSPDTKTG
jgi:hypothetical protein